MKTDYIKSILKELLIYLEVNRQVGHTTAMVEGAGNSDCLIITHNQDMTYFITKDYLKENVKYSKKCVSLGSINLGDLRGRKKPIVFDNAALFIIFRDALNAIKDLEKKKKNRSNRVKKHVLNSN